MSKGLGIWERRIMEAVERDGYAYPGAMAEALRPGSLAARQSALRAAKNLQKKKLLAWHCYSFGSGPKVILYAHYRNSHDGRAPVPDYATWIMETDEYIDVRNE